MMSPHDRLPHSLVSQYECWCYGEDVWWAFWDYTGWLEVQAWLARLTRGERA